MRNFMCGLRARQGARATAMTLAAILALAGCGGPDGTSPGPTGSSTPSASGAEFTLEVMPTTFVGMALGGQRVVLLVTVSGTAADGPVAISAIAEGATITVEPQSLTPGVVGEVSVVPAAVDAETPLTVTVRATRGGAEQSAQRTLTLMPGEDALTPEAAAHLAPFIAWLESEHPELGITTETTWEGGRGGWVLIVEHYQYISEDWELGLSWHVMTAPSDWARIYLRHRWTETEPALAFEISSFSGGADPIEIAPEGIWR